MNWRMQIGKHRSASFVGERHALALHFLYRRLVVRHECSKLSFHEGRFNLGHATLFVPRQPLRKREEAARQQGGLFFRENSSNGGKAIRTFWRNTKFGKMTCQG